MSVTTGPAAATARRWNQLGHEVSDVAYQHEAGWGWWLALLAALGLIGMLAVCLFFVLFDGTGVWGNNVPVTWALDIVAYDWWIGVACGGLLLSGLLLLTGAEWRGAVNRIAETIAVISAAAAGLYPIVHLGRPWFFYWNLPYPNTFALWPQFRSPLYWDAIDIISLLGIALATWFLGMLPDLAVMRDRGIDRLARNPTWLRRLKTQMYGLAALGWRGSAVHWSRYEQALRALALLGVIQVVTLQTGAAVMFAGTVEPGWHDTLLPVSFILTAIFSGVGAVAALLMVLRGSFGLRNLITARHLSLLALVLLGLGIANLYCYGAEYVTSALTGSGYDRTVWARRFAGPHAWSTWAVIVAALLPVHLFWIPALRRSAFLLFIVGTLVAFGTWADHFMVIVVTLQHDFLPSSDFAVFRTSLVGLATFFGTVGLFLFLMLMFVRFFPTISIYGMRRMLTPGAVRRG